MEALAVQLTGFKTPAASVRQATAADIPHMIKIAQEAYPGRGIENGIPWMCWCMRNPERLVLVGYRSFGVANLTWQYGYELRGRMEMLCALKDAAAPLEPLLILRKMIAWAKEKGAKGDFTIDSDTGVDFAAFAKRLGARRFEQLQYKVAME